MRVVGYFSVKDARLCLFAQGITTPVLQLIPTERDPQAQAAQCIQAMKDLAPG